MLARGFYILLTILQSIIQAGARFVKKLKLYFFCHFFQYEYNRYVSCAKRRVGHACVCDYLCPTMVTGQPFLKLYLPQHPKFGSSPSAAKTFNPPPTCKTAVSALNFQAKTAFFPGRGAGNFLSLESRDRDSALARRQQSILPA